MYYVAFRVKEVDNLRENGCRGIRNIVILTKDTIAPDSVLSNTILTRSGVCADEAIILNSQPTHSQCKIMSQERGIIETS